MPVTILLVLGMLAATFVIIHGRSPASVGALGTPAPLSALSPDLGAYAKSQANDIGVVVYDLTRSHYYAYNQDTPFIVASSAKVYILAAYLDQVEVQGR